MAEVDDARSAAAPPRALGMPTAIFLIVASMIGAGVFTTTGFLVADLGSTSAVLAAWGLGGLTAICGALAYAELAAALPHNGGEYTLLSRIYHPAVGFVAGWISLVVGFSAPMAAAALAFGEYTERLIPGADPTVAGLAAILALALLHGLRVRLGGLVQNLVTAATVLLILAFIVAGLARGDLSRLTPLGDPSTVAAITSPAFAVGLVFVSFAYSGWNAAAYIAGEIHDPSRSIPRALLLGTAIVAALYLGLNLVFVIAAPASELAGVVEVGYVAAERLFGDRLLTAAMTGLVALGLLTTVSALMMAGPRVYEALGADYPRFGRLARRLVEGDSEGDRGGENAATADARGPIPAIALQVLLAAAMVLTATFGDLLTYMGMTLALSSGLTVAGVFVLRRREPDLRRPYRTWGHPLTTLIALALMAWMIVFTVGERPMTALVAGATIVAGLGVYFVVRPR